jgi:hypothetical protein
MRNQKITPSSRPTPSICSAGRSPRSPAAFGAFDVRSPLTPLQSALPKNALITRSESALPKTQDLKLFRIRTSKIRRGEEQIVNQRQPWAGLGSARVRFGKNKTRTLETAGCGTRNYESKGTRGEKSLRVEKGGIRGRERKADPSPPFAKRRATGFGMTGGGWGSRPSTSVRRKQRREKSKSPPLQKAQGWSTRGKGWAHAEKRLRL